MARFSPRSFVSSVLDMPKLVLMVLALPIVPFKMFPENALSTLPASAPLPRSNVPPASTHFLTALTCPLESFPVSKLSIIITSNVSNILASSVISPSSSANTIPSSLAPNEFLSAARLLAIYLRLSWVSESEPIYNVVWSSSKLALIYSEHIILSFSSHIATLIYESGLRPGNARVTFLLSPAAAANFFCMATEPSASFLEYSIRNFPAKSLPLFSITASPLISLPYFDLPL